MFKKRPVTKKVPKPDKINTLNTPYLVIVESPSKCKKIESILGFQYKCIASKGHIRSLTKVSRKYEPSYKIVEDKMEHVESLRNIISAVLPCNVFLATDDDREGESIAWHICETYGLSVETTPRILFHEITTNAIQYAIKHPIRIRMNIVYAQQARQILDQMIGFKISPLLSKILVHDKSNFLSAGRCQTPTLRLIFDNEKENQEKQKTIQYSMYGHFFPHPHIQKIGLNQSFEKDIDCQIFLEKSKTFSHILHVEEKSTKTTSPPLPFNTSHLLQWASTTISMSPSRTMELCQQLYQNGFITYMRTDSQKYAASFISTIHNYIMEEYKDTAFIGNPEFITNEGNQTPHEAIRVTNIDVKEIEGDHSMQSLYRGIWKRTIESCMSHYVYEELPFRISAPDDCFYRDTLDTVLFLGWKRMGKESNTETITPFFLSMMEGKKISFHRLESVSKLTNHVSHYTEASMIKKLEEIGIGRPSTYSFLVNIIQERNYVSQEDILGYPFHCKEYILENETIEVIECEKQFGKEKNKLVLQELGKKTIHYLVSNFASLFSYEYTRYMEEKLDKVLERKDVQNICQECDEEIQKCIVPLKKVIHHLYEVEPNYHVRFGSKGAIIQHTLEDGSIQFLPMSSSIDIDMQKLEKKEYLLTELLATPEQALGEYDNELIYVKKGPFGFYAQWGENKISLKGFVSKNFTYENVVEYIDSKQKKTSVLRTIAHDILLMKGKFGPYIHYHPPKSKKPSYLTLKHFPDNYLTCDIEKLQTWITKEYSISFHP